MNFSKTLVQFLKFGIVGISNTLLTAATIWLLLRVFHSSNYLANIVGYVVGLVNSFIWNRRWTFENHAQVGATIFKFIVTFAISYLLQLGFLSFLLHQTNIDDYVCQLLSIVVYTVVNFFMNKYYTFKTEIK
ncbi:MAG: GtrA family protein [Paludibacteraceae bacterium]|jgi:putative flippase GtrA|nr:GtrA family protein [Paludibacteraceae bacterium]MBP9016954.1 GtrA family protein [Paludibacteraceae bacterium]